MKTYRLITFLAALVITVAIARFFSNQDIGASQPTCCGRNAPEAVRGDARVLSVQADQAAS